VPGLGASFGRGGATGDLQDLSNADVIVIQGSNMAECHPVGFQWVMEAKARGAKVFHIDPRFTRTSALADHYVPIRTGTDIVLLGAIINRVLTQERDFREYVVAYTNASHLISEDFQDTEDLDGLFSGFDHEKRSYDTSSWQYAGSEHRGDDEAHGIRVAIRHRQWPEHALRDSWRRSTRHPAARFPRHPRGLASSDSCACRSGFACDCP